MNNRLFWLGLAGSASFIAAAAVQPTRLRLPWSAWSAVLFARHGANIGQSLLEKAMTNRQTWLARQQPLPKPPLRAVLLDNILPGLGMYQALLEMYGEPQAALTEIEPLFQAWTQALYGGMMRSIRLLPNPFWFFRIGTVMQLKGYPADTWKTVWKENSARRVAFDQFSCYYLDTLAACGAPELTPAYCQIDDWMAKMLPHGIAFCRTQTLARGGDRCDFCYEKKR